MAAEPDYHFTESDRPAVAGAPYTPPLRMGLRIAYAVNAVAIAMLSTFCQSLYATNIAFVAGGYGITQADAGWLSVVYSGLAASCSLFLIKGRQQFGIDRVIVWLLTLYIASSVLLLLLPSFETALIGRTANGLVTSTATALAVYYLLQVLPPKKRPAAIVLVLGLLQLGGPLARMVPVELVTYHGNLGLHLVNLGIPLAQLALILAFPLPPSLTEPVFERLDLYTVGLLMPAIFLLAAVLGLGRTHWWIDTPWLGWMLATAVALFAGGILLEYGRTRPTLSIDWMTQGDIVRFAAVVLVQRIALAEQSVGAVGLLQAAGLDNDQMHGLFAVVMLAEIAGIAIAVLTLSEKAVPFQAMGALLLIAAAAWIDGGANGLTRPREMLLSQALIGLGTTLFVGPALIWIVLRMFRSGSQYLLTMIMVFSFTQNVGSLIGAAMLSSYQYRQSERHGTVIAGQLNGADPLVAARIRGAAEAFVPVTPDASARAALGAGTLGRSAARQAGILGLLDVFRMVAVLALAGTLGMAIWHVRATWRQSRKKGKA